MQTPGTPLRVRLGKLFPKLLQTAEYLLNCAPFLDRQGSSDIGGFRRHMALGNKTKTR